MINITENMRMFLDLKFDMFFIAFLNTYMASRIIKNLARGCFYYFSFPQKVISWSSYMLYKQHKHRRFVAIELQLDWLKVTKATVTCLNW